MQDVARSMAEIEETALCIEKCPCIEVKSFLWADNQQNELAKKDFTGTQNDAMECMEIDPELNVWDKKILNWIEDLEKTYQCAGLCNAATFFSFSDVTAGPPAAPCLDFIIEDELKTNITQFGYLYLISGLLVFVTFYF